LKPPSILGATRAAAGRQSIVTVELIEQEVSALRASFGAGGAHDAGTRAACAAALDRLRAHWRRAPELFGDEAMSTLKEISRALRGSAPARAPYLPGLGPAGAGQAGESSDGAGPGRPPAAAVPPETVRAALKSIYGYDRFRPGQEEIISAVLAGRDCLGVMPTGAGKSLTYQIPARLLGGTTLVVSPLIALMKDQVDAMNEVGLRATFLNSSLAPDERRARLQGLWSGAYELVYAAPEGLEASVGWALGKTRLSLIAIDEAHCISQWGHDFRPAYRNLAGLKRRFGGVPVLALTATATPDVMRDIVDQLAMVAPAEYRGSFFRRNLKLSAYRKGGDGDGAGRGGGGRGGSRAAIRRFVQARSGKSGIIYCLSRKATESTAEYLREHGVRAAAYHAGLPNDERARTQDAFRRDDIDVVVATVAFGMGIDKPDIRYVVHRDMPRSIESYYQEIGRAGRDGLPSECVLFYSWADVMSYDRFESEGTEDVQERQREQVREMFRLADNGARCRHQAITGYLGEAVGPCGTSCDVCTGHDVLAACAEPAGRRGKRARGGAGSQTGIGASADGVGRGDRALGSQGDGEEAEIFARLRELRRRLATQRGIPAYMVFSDAVLLAMAERRPRTAAAVLEISGVGPKKLAQYGDAFLSVLCGESPADATP
jgi:ATP-dependent DNA helicase RecQ